MAYSSAYAPQGRGEIGFTAFAGMTVLRVGAAWRGAGLGPVAPTARPPTGAPQAFWPKNDVLSRFL